MPEYTALQKDYAKYRLDKFREDLDVAQLLFRQGSYRIANNRAYYSIFHALGAVLVIDNFDTSKHSGVIAEFRRRYKGRCFSDRNVKNDWLGVYYSECI